MKIQATARYFSPRDGAVVFAHLLVENYSGHRHQKFRNFWIIGFNHYCSFDFARLNALGIQPDRTLPTIALGPPVRTRSSKKKRLRVDTDRVVDEGMFRVVAKVDRGGGGQRGPA